MSLAEEIGREIREKYGTSSHVDEIVQLVKERCAREAEIAECGVSKCHDIAAARIRSL